MCGGQLYGPSGVVVSPDNDGDGYYDNNQYCTWHIRVAEHPWSVIRYTFLYFAVAPSDNCVKDRLLVGNVY